MAATATEAPRGPGQEPLRTRVLGVPVDVCPDVFAAACALQERGGGQVVTLNAEMTMAALADRSLGEAIEAAKLVIPDGAGVVWALGRQGLRVRRAPGIELAHRLLEHAAAVGWRVALVGASPAVMAQLTTGLRQQLPRLQPDLVLVALGVPRQETWISRLPQRRGGLWMGVGGSFDVWAGTKKRAPRWMGALQVEWLYRLVQEPHRWRRMLALPQFALAVLKAG
jgi:N-acetylglucosaminyldiphosphoundecaprenol N-acetyl-beta-D-mannosaminyltransferase